MPSTIGIMCWRLEATTDSLQNPDFTYHFTIISLISNFELWLGIIAACIPTLAPLMKSYVRPALSKIKGLSSGSSQGHGQIHLNSIERMNNRRRYYNIEGVQTTDSDYALRTECIHDPQAEELDIPSNPDAIHVQRGIEYQTV